MPVKQKQKSRSLKYGLQSNPLHELGINRLSYYHLDNSPLQKAKRFGKTGFIQKFMEL